MPKSVEPRKFGLSNVLCCPRNARSAGATIVEFSFAFLIFAFLLIGLFDFARYYTINGLLNKAANRSLMVAQTVPGMEYAYDTDADRIAAYEQGKALVEAEAQRLLSGASFLAPFGGHGMAVVETEEVLQLPARQGNRSYDQTLQDEPITAQIDVQFQPLLPFLPVLRIRGRAVGYREPRSALSRPAPLDCMGNPVGTVYFNTFCTNCAANELWNASLSRCLPCRPGTKPGGGQCVCDNSVPCPGNQRRSMTYVWNNSLNISEVECVCDCNPRNGGYDEKQDGRPDFETQPDFSCTCPAGSNPDTDGRCSCPAPATPCQPGQVYSSDSGCGCVCPAGTRIVDSRGCIPNTCANRGCADCSNCPER